MRTARRLYVYLLSGVGLAVLASGLALLLGVLFDAVGLGFGEAILGGGEAIRERLTLASAMTAVSLPVWLIHWYLAERSVRPGAHDVQLDRSSALRGLYFALALGASLVAAVGSAQGLIEAVALRVAGSPDAAYRDVAGGLATLLVASAVWGYHFWVRMRDWRHGPMTGAGAWLPRTYLYGAALGGLLLLLAGLTGLFDVAVRAVLDAGYDFGPGSGSWWSLPLATAIAQVATGGAVWIGHWLYSVTLLADPGWRGQDERPARLRVTYLVAAIVAGAVAVVAFVGIGTSQALASLLDVPDVRGGSAVAAEIVQPILSAIPFAFAWWIHTRWMRAEAMSADDVERIRAVDRLDDYAVALVGLGFGAVAAASLIGLLIDVTLGGGRALSGPETWRRELAQYVPLVVLGSALWLWRWSLIARRYASAPAREAASTSRRTALLGVLAVAILAGIAALGVILYRAFGAVFGVSLGGDVVAELSRPIGAVVTAVAVALYYGLALRRDQGLRMESGLSAVGAGAGPSEGAEIGEVPAPAVLAVTLRLSGPIGADLRSTIHGLRANLPDGYELDEVDGAGD